MTKPGYKEQDLQSKMLQILVKIKVLAVTTNLIFDILINSEQESEQLPRNCWWKAWQNLATIRFVLDKSLASMIATSTISRWTSLGRSLKWGTCSAQSTFQIFGIHILKQWILLVSVTWKLDTITHHKTSPCGNKNWSIVLHPEYLWMKNCFSTLFFGEDLSVGFPFKNKQGNESGKYFYFPC